MIESILAAIFGDLTKDFISRKMYFSFIALLMGIASLAFGYMFYNVVFDLITNPQSTAKVIIIGTMSLLILGLVYYCFRLMKRAWSSRNGWVYDLTSTRSAIVYRKRKTIAHDERYIPKELLFERSNHHKNH